MKHRFLQFSASMSICSLLILQGGTANASTMELQESTARNDRAEIEIKSTQPYQASKTTIKEKFGTLLTQLPFVKRVQIMNETEETLQNRNDYTETFESSQTLLLEFEDSRILEPSLFDVKVERVECTGHRACGRSTEWVLTGPIHTYHSNLEWRQSLGLNESFKLELRTEPYKSTLSGGPSRLTFALVVESRSYLRFFRHLTESRLMSRMPVETELQGAFLLWGQEALQKVLGGN